MNPNDDIFSSNALSEATAKMSEIYRVSLKTDQGIEGVTNSVKKATRNPTSKKINSMYDEVDKLKKDTNYTLRTSKIIKDMSTYIKKLLECRISNIQDQSKCDDIVNNKQIFNSVDTPTNSRADYVIKALVNTSRIISTNIEGNRDTLTIALNRKLIEVKRILEKSTMIIELSEKILNKLDEYLTELNNKTLSFGLQGRIKTLIRQDEPDLSELPEEIRDVINAPYTNVPHTEEHQWKPEKRGGRKLKSRKSRKSRKVKRYYE